MPDAIFTNLDGSKTEFVMIGGTFPGDPFEMIRLKPDGSRVDKERQIIPAKDTFAEIQKLYKQRPFPHAVFTNVDGSSVHIVPVGGTARDNPMEIKFRKADGSIDTSKKISK